MWGKVVTGTRGRDGGVKKLSAGISSKLFTAKQAIAEYVQSCLVKLGFHNFSDCLAFFIVRDYYMKTKPYAVSLQLYPGDYDRLINKVIRLVNTWCCCADVSSGRGLISFATQAIFSLAP